jgi:hypothetical protein
MTKRNLKQELMYYSYVDMENGNDTETVDYGRLINLLGEILDRLDSIEATLNGD